MVRNPELLIFKRLEELYNIYDPHEWLWAANFSGGKDSSAMLWALLKFAKNKEFTFLVLHSDTTVEIPAVSRYVREVLNYMEKQGMQVRILSDIPNFFTTMLERGYGFPRWNFRWCCRIYKYGRGVKFLKKLGKVVNLLGIRGDEGRADSFITVKKKLVTAYPLIDLRLGDIWQYLEREYPWYDVLVKFYEAGGRLGCWTCTVIPHDRTLKHIDPELYRIKVKLVKARCMGLKYFLEALEEAVKKRPEAFPHYELPASLRDTSCRGKCFKCNVRKYWWYKNRDTTRLKNLT